MGLKAYKKTFKYRAIFNFGTIAQFLSSNSARSYFYKKLVQC